MPQIARFAACALVTLTVAACTAEPTLDQGTSTTLPRVTTAPTTTLLDDQSTTTTTAPAFSPLDEITLGLVEVASGFDQPVLALSRGGDDRLFVVDQSGHLWAVESGEKMQVLDIANRVDFGGERGFLGAAFHPEDPTRLFVHYSRRGDGATVIEEYRYPTGADAVDPEPVGTLFTVAQPAGNHNGGMIAFGPDGRLYIALGDGGASNDQFRQAQDPFTLLGTILRIDVDLRSPYAIPADNPFADGTDGAPEVWLYGLRNPWRFSWDGADLWIADVGQGSIEEVNLLTIDDGGSNLGWPAFEGTLCVEFQGARCEPDTMTMPVYEYGREGGRCSVTGGLVYRGTESVSLWGAYVFGDYCSREIIAIRVADGTVTEDTVLGMADDRITSFGIDHAGELYVVTTRAVYRIVATAP
jgi:glucose/arabinose dehydrogenase